MKTSGNSSEISDGFLMSMPVDQQTQIDNLAKQKNMIKNKTY